MKTFLRPFCPASLVRWLLGLLLLLAAAPARAQAPANDDPTGAIVLPLTATCTPTAGTTVGATNTAANGYLSTNCGGLSGPGNGTTGYQPDVWYRFTTPAAGAAASRAVRLTLTGNAAGLVRVFTTPVGSAGPFSEVRCASSGAANTAVGNVDLIGLQPATIYYLLVGGYAATDPLGSFTICVSDPTPCGDPQNVAVSGIGATTAQLDFRPGNGNVRYTVVVTRQGSPPVTITPAPTSAPIALTGLIANSAYTVTLQATCANGGTSAVLTRTFRTTFGNDEPQDAVQLPVGRNACVPTNGTTTGATVTPNVASCIGFSSSNDVWYKIEAPTDVYFQIAVTGNAGEVRLYENSLQAPMISLNLLTCSRGSITQQGGQVATAPALFYSSANANSTLYPYYIAVSPVSSTGAGGPFTICVTQQAAFPTCRPPIINGYAQLTQTTALLSFLPNPLGAPGGYTITAVPQGSGSTVIVTASAGLPGVSSSVSLTGLTPGTVYIVTIVGQCSATSQTLPVSTSFTTLYLPPANEQCSSAIPISCGQTLSGSLNGASNFTPVLLTCNGNNVGYNNVFYRLVGTGTPITVSLCSPNTQVPDNALIVLQGSCNNLTCVGANTSDPTCPTRNAKVTFSSIAGQPYTLVVHNQLTGTFTGNFDLTATCAAPTCGAVTGVAASALSATSARVAFAAPVGGAAPTGYTVALTPASGPAVTVPAAASPVVVPGLLPNTIYTACVTTNCGAAASPSSCAPAFTTPLGARNAALAAQLGLFPNPAHRRATLTVPAALLRQAGLLSLLDGLGRVAQQRFLTPAPGRATDTRTELDLTGLPAGIYTLRLLSSEGPLTRRLVVE